jgi:hypothetical protein
MRYWIGNINEFHPTFQFDAKLFLLTHRMQLEVICVFTPFLDYLHQFDPKKNSRDVGFNV